MNLRDVALVAYRLLGLWIGASGAMALGEALITWKSSWAQIETMMATTTNPMSETALFWMSMSALAFRGLFGGLLWWAAPLLARHTPVGERCLAGEEPARAALYSAAAFLVGVWLLSVSLPGLAFEVHAARRAGAHAHEDGLGGARIVELVAQLLLGAAFVRGGWLVDLAIGSRPRLDAVEDKEEDPAP